MRRFTRLIAVAMVALALTHSSPSKAVVGFAVGSPLIAVAGLCFGAGNAAMTFFAVLGASEKGLILHGLGTILGLVILDGEQGQTLAFSELDEKSAKQIGLTTNELASYNAEIDQVNALYSEVIGNISSLTVPTDKDAAEAWEELRPLVSEDTFSALQKVATRAFVK